MIDYAEKNQIQWYKPELIFTSAELLDLPTRQKIENYFGKKVYDIYGSTELKEVAWECPFKRGYHINDDLYFVEVVNPNEQEVGDIVITALTNKAMPLIRIF